MNILNKEDLNSNDAQFWDQMADQVWGLIQNQVGNLARDLVWIQVHRPVRNLIWSLATNSIWSQTYENFE